MYVRKEEKVLLRAMQRCQRLTSDFHRTNFYLLSDKNEQTEFFAFFLIREFDP